MIYRLQLSYFTRVTKWIKRIKLN